MLQLLVKQILQHREVLVSNCHILYNFLFSTHHDSFFLKGKNEIHILIR
jgi:hypothetical protein